MIYLWRFIYYFRRNRYAKALACLPLDNANNGAQAQYALYRLGLYRSVLSTSPIYESWYSIFSHIVSNGIYADHQKLNSILEHGKSKVILKNKMSEISVALLPYSPEWSIKLLPKNARDSIRVAALLKLGNVEAAKNICKKKVGEGDPEMYLLYANACRLDNESQLNNVNRFLNEFKLSPLRLRSLAEPIGANNLVSREILKSTDGPLVSIIVTAFRCVRRLENSLKSLLNQTYRNIEIIVIDDASDDNLDDVVRRLQKKDSRVKYRRLPINVGTYAAKSIGMQLAKGEFVTCQDADDWAHPEKISLQVIPLLKDRKIVYTVSNLVRVRDDGVFYSRSVFPLVRLNPSSVLFRKDIVKSKTGFWDLVRTGADSEFIARLRIVFGKRGMKKINKPLSFCAHRPNSLMTSSETGYSATGFSKVRFEYWDSFSKWHIECLRKNHLPKIANDLLGSREFFSPVENLVSIDSLNECILTLQLSESI